MWISFTFILCLPVLLLAQPQPRRVRTTTWPSTTTPRTFATSVARAQLGFDRPRVRPQASGPGVPSRSNVAPGTPNAWVALDDLRGRTALTAEDIQLLMVTLVPGVDFPLISRIPEETRLKCDQLRQPGFYADQDYRCQVFRRCDPEGNMYSYLCPNMTLFNQITLTCDFFFNVDCAKSANYYDYSNSRLYREDAFLLD